MSAWAKSFATMRVSVCCLLVAHVTIQYSHINYWLSHCCLRQRFNIYFPVIWRTCLILSLSSLLHKRLAPFHIRKNSVTVLIWLALFEQVCHFFSVINRNVYGTTSYWRTLVQVQIILACSVEDLCTCLVTLDRYWYTHIHIYLLSKRQTQQYFTS